MLTLGIDVSKLTLDCYLSEGDNRNYSYFVKLNFYFLILVNHVLIKANSSVCLASSKLYPLWCGLG